MLPAQRFDLIPGKRYKVHEQAPLPQFAGKVVCVGSRDWSDRSGYWKHEVWVWLVDDDDKTGFLETKWLVGEGS